MTNYNEKTSEFARLILASDESKYFADATDALKGDIENPLLRTEFLQKKSEYEEFANNILEALRDKLGLPTSSGGGCGCGSGGCCRGRA